MAEKKNVKQVIDKAINTLTKDVPEVVKENKGAAIGAVIGYFLADAVEKYPNVIPAVLGGLVGHAVDEKKKKDVF